FDTDWSVLYLYKQECGMAAAMPATHALLVRDDAPPMDTPASQIRDGVVDLLQGIPLGHQGVQVELAALIPAHKDGEIAVRATQAAACPSIRALGNTKLRHTKAPESLARPHQTRRAAWLEADCARPRGVQDLLLGARRPNGINGVVHPAGRQGLNGLHGITVRRIDPMCGPKTLGKSQLVVAQVDRDDRVGPNDMGSSDGTQPD